MTAMDSSLQVAITEWGPLGFSRLYAEKNVCAYRLWFVARRLAG